MSITKKTKCCTINGLNLNDKQWNFGANKEEFPIYTDQFQYQLQYQLQISITRSSFAFFSFHIAMYCFSISSALVLFIHWVIFFLRFFRQAFQNTGRYSNLLTAYSLISTTLDRDVTQKLSNHKITAFLSPHTSAKSNQNKDNEII